MNIQFRFLLFALIFASSSKAQYSDTLVLFQKDQEVYLLADSVNVRKEPNAQSAVVAKLPIGTKLKVLDKSSIASKINNILMPWYLVSFDGKEKGYVWGGKIAKTSFRSNKNLDIIFHFGMEKMENNTINYQIRVEQLGHELQRITFKGFFGYNKQHTCTNISNKGLDNVDDIIQVDGFGEACGDDGGAIIFFWSNNKLSMIDKLYDMSDVPTFGRSYFVYPSDMEGKKGIVIKREEEGEMLFFDDEKFVDDWHKNAIRYDKKVATNYKWDGSKLIKLN